jgi:hypothetical protein
MYAFNIHTALAHTIYIDESALCPLFTGRKFTCSRFDSIGDLLAKRVEIIKWATGWRGTIW